MQVFLNTRASITDTESNERVQGWVHSVHETSFVVRLDSMPSEWIGRSFAVVLTDGDSEAQRCVGEMVAINGNLATVEPTEDWIPVSLERENRRQIQGLYATWLDIELDFPTPVMDEGSHGFGVLLPIALPVGTVTSVRVSWRGKAWVMVVEVQYCEPCARTHFGFKHGVQIKEYKHGELSSWVQFLNDPTVLRAA